MLWLLFRWVITFRGHYGAETAADGWTVKRASSCFQVCLASEAPPPFPAAHATPSFLVRIAETCDSPRRFSVKTGLEECWKVIARSAVSHGAAGRPLGERGAALGKTLLLCHRYAGRCQGLTPPSRPPNSPSLSSARTQRICLFPPFSESFHGRARAYSEAFTRLDLNLTGSLVFQCDSEVVEVFFFFLSKKKKQKARSGSDIKKCSLME